jgi:hypothetical protein
MNFGASRLIGAGRLFDQRDFFFAEAVELIDKLVDFPVGVLDFTRRFS